MEIIVAYSCEDSSMLTSYIIDVEIIFHFSLNKIISLGPISCFRFVNINLYILKVSIAKTKISNCGLSRIGIHQ